MTGLSGGVTGIGVSGDSTCALTASGGVQCWGYNAYGELGNGAATSTSSSIPVAVTGLSSGVTGISVGGGEACALTDGGGVKCWGDNDQGALGNGTTTDTPIPVAVTGLSHGVTAITAITANHYSTCVLAVAGGVKCLGWGALGQLGNGTTTSSSAPVAVTGLSSGVTAISDGEESVCAVTRGGGVECWGNNEAGQLGNGTKVSSTVPVDVSGF